MPGIFVIVGESDDEARENYEQLQSLVDPVSGLALLARIIGNFDLSGYDVDGPLPELPLTQTGQRSRQELLTSLARGENLTIRQLYLKIAGGRGHFSAIGSPRSVADHLQRWFEESAADGFNIMPAYLPGGFGDFARLVVPELQKRGLFRTHCECKTLRENLGLPFPTAS